MGLIRRQVETGMACGTRQQKRLSGALLLLTLICASLSMTQGCGKHGDQYNADPNYYKGVDFHSKSKKHG